MPFIRVTADREIHARCDVGDYEELARHGWRLDRDGYVMRNLRKHEWPKRGSQQMARDIMGLKRGDKRTVDHINRNKLDNRRQNLRVCTNAQNCQNRDGAHRDSISRYRGVGWDAGTGKWAVVVVVDGTHHRFGYFTDEDEAGRVAADARRTLMPYSQEVT